MRSVRKAYWWAIPLDLMEADWDRARRRQERGEGKIMLHLYPRDSRKQVDRGTGAGAYG